MAVRIDECSPRVIGLSAGARGRERECDRGFYLHSAILLAALLAGAAWWTFSGTVRKHTAGVASDERRGILPRGAPSDFFSRQTIGDAIRGDERPQISNVQIVDLDRDGLADVLVCDVLRGRVTWIRQFPKGVFTEVAVGDPIKAPAHVEAIDFDHDGDLDLVVASLGVLNPSNNRVGSVVVLENDGHQRFVNHVVASNIARVADVRAGDLDGDGDLDLAVAGFGYDDGETSWLENKGGWTFEQHVLLRLSGPINAIVADINHDGAPDIVALVSQEWEEIWVFVNDGRGHFTPKMIWGSTNPDFGSSWISVVDLDRDGDLDILYSNGDAFDYAPANSRPWHGVQWLENTGNAAVRVPPHRGSAWRVEPAGRRHRWRRRSGRRGRERVQQLGRPRGPQPGLAGKQRSHAVHLARHRRFAHAPDHAGGRGPRRRRHVGSRDRRHVHQSSVRSDVAHHGMEPSWSGAATVIVAA